MKKIISVLLCLLLLAALFTGCEDVKAPPETGTGSPAQTSVVPSEQPVELTTAAEVVQQVTERMANVDSMRVKMLVTLSFGVSGEELGAMNFSMTGDYDCEMTKQPRASHMKGVVSGMGQEQAAESYTFEENGKTVVYNWDPEQSVFIRTEKESGAGQEADSFNLYQSVEKGEWTLERTPDAYVLRGELPMDTFNATLPAGTDVLGMGTAITDADYKAPAVVTIDRQTLYLRTVTLDMGKAFGNLLSTLGMSDGDMTVTMEAAFSDYNAVGPITAPADYQQDPGSSEVTEPTVDPGQHDYQEPTARDYSDISAEELAKVHPMLFKVTDSRGTVMYLFGTIHVGDGRNRYVLDLMSSFLDECDALAVEADVKALEADLQASLDMAMQFLYTDGTTAKDHMPADLYDRASALLAEAGMAPALMNYYNLAMWSMSVEQAVIMTRTDLSADDAMDGALIQYCYNNRIPVREVESAQLQYDLLLSFPDELNLLMMKSTLDSLDAAGESIDALYQTWLGGDYDEILAKTVEDGEGGDGYTPEELALLESYNEKMLDKRNLGMKDRAIEWLNAGDTVFFAVGAAHLVGETGLVTLLREAGCTVEQIDYIGNP